MRGGRGKGKRRGGLGLGLALAMLGPVGVWAQPAAEAAAEEPDAEEQVEAVLERWQRAVAEADPEALGELLAADAVFYPDGAGALEGREAVVDAYRQLFAQYRVEAKLETTEIRVEGALAVVEGEESFVLEPAAGGDRLEVGPRRMISVLEEQDGVWRFVSGMTSSLPGEP